MSTSARLRAVIGLLVAAVGSTAAAQSLQPEWSRPVGGRTRLVGVEEYGRCSVFVDNGAVQVVTPSGAVSWSWRFSTISKYINPREVAVSHDCDAIAFVGDAGYKYVWIVDRAGASASIKFTSTPADVEFDRAGKLVAVGTYAGSLFLYSTNGTLQWKRDTKAAIVNDLDFTDDNQQIVFKGWAGAGVVSLAGQVEWSRMSNRLAASRDLATLIFGNEPNHGPGLPGITVTDGNANRLWFRWAAIDASVSATGDRILAMIDDQQTKQEDDFFAKPQPATIQLLSREGAVLAAFADYRSPIALSEEGDRLWLQAADYLACVDERGGVLARIEGEVSNRGVVVSRNFGQVLVVREKDLHPVAVERYEVPKPCRP
jgi:hypothetical protein